MKPLTALITVFTCLIFLPDQVKSQPVYKTNQAYSLESLSNPQNYISYSGATSIISEVLSEDDKVKQAFQIVNGLDDISAISLQSVKNRDYFLCNSNGRLSLKKRQGNSNFRRDEATFFMFDGFAGNSTVSFESKSDRGKYIQTKNNQLVIATGSDPSFARNASFRLRDPFAISIPNRTILSLDTVLHKGTHFYKLNGQIWEEVTGDLAIRRLINAPNVPKGNKRYNQDWYFMELDQNKTYRFKAESRDFDIEIGTSFTYTKKPNNLQSPQWRSRTAKIIHPRTGMEEYRPDNSGAHWVVITSKFGGKTGKYKFTYTVYQNSASPNVSYNESSIVAALNVPNLTPGPEEVFINFDGFSFESRFNTVDTLPGRTHHLNAFDAQPYLAKELKNAKTKEGVIQHLLYKVSEIYAPFNVHISRIRGIDNLVPSRTSSNIFVGDDPNGAIYGVAHGTVHNFDFGNKRMDVGWLDVQDSNGFRYAADQLYRTIAHEIGHTFGLAHVRTRGGDYPPSFSNLAAWLNTRPNVAQANPLASTNTMPELMSYDSENCIIERHNFASTAFNNIDRNGNGIPTLEWDGARAYPRWKNTRMQTQNSYMYLSTILGRRFPDLIANVADRSAIMQAPERAAVYLYSLSPSRISQGVNSSRDRKTVEEAGEGKIRASIKAFPAIVNKIEVNSDGTYGRGSSGTSTIDHLGDYDVFLHSLPIGQAIVRIKVTPATDSPLDPIVLVYDETGKRLISYIEDTEVVSTVDVGLKFSTKDMTPLIQRIKIVVGAKDNNTKGTYDISFF